MGERRGHVCGEGKFVARASLCGEGKFVARASLCGEGKFLWRGQVFVARASFCGEGMFVARASLWRGHLCRGHSCAEATCDEGSVSAACALSYRKPSSRTERAHLGAWAAVQGREERVVRSSLCLRATQRRSTPLAPATPARRGGALLPPSKESEVP